MEEYSCVFSGDSPDGGRVRFVLTGDRLTVGRQGDLLLSHSSVSRNHALLERHEGGWFVSDLGSRNGTSVNGVSVQRHRLSNGDVVCFGRVKLHFDVEGSDNSEDGETCAMSQAPLTFADIASASGRSLVGRSVALKNAMRLAARAAKSNATVLLFGESGTGKELFARLVWEESARREKIFVPVHSGAIEPNLLAATLFGHEKGAFTGAISQKKGLFEEADGGTIFLDEIGEICPETQVKLLRVLQEGEFMRVGGTTPIKVNVRVICATNRDLAAAVRAGTFREDLYYRLNVIQIHLPPLRERPEDIADLVGHYVGLLGGMVRTVSPEAMSILCRYRWPGNVRELRNVVERMIVLGGHDQLEVDDIPVEIRNDVAASSSASPVVPAPKTDMMAEPHLDGGGSLVEIERRCIVTTLEECGGNKKLAAERLGISRSTLYEKLKACPNVGHGEALERSENGQQRV